MAGALPERNLLKTAYSGDAWKKKVDKMTDAQVIAIVRRLQAQKKL